MLQNAYFLAKIGADTAKNERNFAENLPKIGNYPTGPTIPRVVLLIAGFRALPQNDSVIAGTAQMPHRVSMPARRGASPLASTRRPGR